MTILFILGLILMLGLVVGYVDIAGKVFKFGMNIGNFLYFDKIGNIILLIIFSIVTMIIILILFYNDILLSTYLRSRVPYCLILGSFSRLLDEEELTETPFTFGDYTYEIDRAKSEREYNSTEDCLSEIRSTRFVRIGGRGAYNILVLNSADDKWFDVFQILARGARAIIIVPGLTPSLQEEIAAICSSPPLVRKSIILQPPVFYFNPSYLKPNSLLTPDEPPRNFGTLWHYDVSSSPMSNRWRNWEMISKKFKKINISLPGVCYEGQAVLLGPDGDHKVIPGRDGLSRLIQEAQGEHACLAEVLPKLDGLIRTRIRLKKALQTGSFRDS